MKHFKLYEDFFSFFKFDRLNNDDCQKLFGLTRQDIEERLYDITDDIDGLHISINFIVNGRCIDSEQIELSPDGKSFKDEWDVYDIEKTEIQIHMYVTPNLLKKYYNHEGINVVSGIDITPLVKEIDSLMDKNKIKEYLRGLGYSVSLNKRTTVTNRFHNIYDELTNKNVQFGSDVYNIFLFKNIK